MLTRVISEEQGQHAPRINWRTPTKTFAQPVASPAPKQPHPSVEPEVDRLHARVRQLEQSLEHRVSEARQAGFHEGEAAEKNRNSHEVAGAVKRLAQATAEAAQLRALLFRQTESDVVKLSLEIARRVLRRELTIDPSVLEGLVKVALEKLQSQEIYRVRVHPDHQAIMQSSLARHGAGLQIEVVGDPAQRPGGAIFEINNGRLDASIETQLQEIEQGLADRFQRS